MNLKSKKAIMWRNIRAINKTINAAREARDKCVCAANRAQWETLVAALEYDRVKMLLERPKNL